jgi:pimeloyl-ACP methyl ester carboxylesterase
MFYLLGLFLIMGLAYLYWIRSLVPRIQLEVPDLPTNPAELENFIQTGEAQEELRPDNQARIVWQHQDKRPTPYSLVYVHGFSASQGEGAPIHLEFAQRFGCNLYLSRLAHHGYLNKEAISGFETQSILNSAALALAVGQKIGEKVVLMGTSTGCSLMLYLASQHPEIAGLICYSPNVALKSPFAFLITLPWGQKLVQLSNKGKDWVEKNEEENPYWDRTYHIRAVVRLQALLRLIMRRSVFKTIQQPFFMGYYYKNEKQQDQTVSVPAMLRMFRQLGTHSSQKRKVAFPEAGGHALANRFYGQDLDAVRRETFAFAEEVLGLQAK